MARMQLGSNVVIPAIQVGGNEVAGYTLDEYNSAFPITGNVIIKSVKIAKYRSFFYRFAGCGDMKSISFPELESIENQGLQRALSECTNLEHAYFPALSTIFGGGMTGTFNSCTSLTRIDFPALATVLPGAFGTSSLCFAKCTGLTAIHFPAAIQSTIESLTGYASKFGAVNATIYFDL